MIHNQRLIVVMPAYNAEGTIEKTVRAIPEGFVDEVIVVDDASRDGTSEAAARLGLTVLRHPKNRGYGGNQKTCYREALRRGADVVVMLHPDYQYSPRLVAAMASMVACGEYDAVLGSRILGGTARRGGMPVWKYIANRGLTLFQNLMMGAKLSEYHTGYRAFSREVLERLPLDANSDDFVFDNQMLAQIVWSDFRIGEVSCPTKYFDDASSINFRRSVTYGFGVLSTSLAFRAARWGLASPRFLSPDGRRLQVDATSD
jgi:glycosyltransferase involved in cell wall biosynthesis